MNRYIVTSITEIASGTMLLTIEPQTEQDRLVFHPGQYASIGFRVAGRPTPMRSFSIVSSPTDGNKLQFAFRVQGRFTTALSRLRTGSGVLVQGPFGNFTIDPNYDRRVVMFAGGIGVTPFISMIRYATATELPTPTTLLYSCRSFADIPFYDELRTLEARNPYLKVYYFISDERVPTNADAQVIAGRPSAAVFDQLTGEKHSGSTYFMCGPQGMMRAVEARLADRNITADRIVTESFAQSLSLWERASPARVTYGLVAAALLICAGIITSLDVSKKVAQNQSATKSATATSSTTSSSSGSTSNSASTGTTSGSTSTSSNTANQQSPMSSVS